MLQQIREFIEKNAALRSLVVALLAVLVLVGFYVAMLRLDGPLLAPIIQPNSNDLYAFYAFSIIFLVLWGVIYHTVRSDLQDALSEVRKKLLGPWRVIYRSYELNGNHWRKREFPTDCTIKLDDISKLMFTMTLHGTDYFERTTHYIKHITIGPGGGPERELMFFYEVDLRVKQEMRNVLGVDRCKGSFVVIMHFKDDGDTVSEMNGTWFDMERLVPTCHARAAAYKSSLVSDSNSSLDEVPNDAHKGDIVFERIPSR